jgi:cellulose synthase/poly-beta-1,6-N-acetylglucosamine synthase-like glycosyltransferase
MIICPVTNFCLDSAVAAAFINNVLKPPVYHSSDLIFNAVLIFATVFSVLFYILAVNGIFSRPAKKLEFGEIPKDGLPFVTIQIPTFNEPVAIRCAQKCLEMDYPKERYEILIGDDSNDEKTSAMIEEFAGKHKEILKVIRRPDNKGFKAGNLNNMLKHSRGEIIAIFDSDFVPSKDFLSKAVLPFQDKQVAAVQSRWEFMNANQNFVSRLSSSILIVYHHLTLPLINRFGVSFICGSAEAVRKDVLLRLGGWQNGSLTEDTEFSMRIMEMGYRSVYLPDLVTPGESPFTVKGFRRQQMRWAYGTVRAFMDHKKEILFNKNFNAKQRLMLFFVLLGYFTAPLLALLFVSGTMAFITNVPGPIDLTEFVRSVSRNLLLTSGFIAASIVALKKNRRLGIFPKLLLSSFTVGIIISFSVSVAIFKSLLKKPMEWYIIQKSGNDAFSAIKASADPAGIHLVETDPRIN